MKLSLVALSILLCGIVPSFLSALVHAAPPVIERIVSEGEPVPGGAAGETFDNPGITIIANDAGQIAFFGSVQGPDVSAVNNRGIWLYSEGSTDLIARGGSPVPGEAAGVRYGSITSRFWFNHSGVLIFRSTLEGTGQSTAPTAVFIYDGNAVQRLLQVGDSAPGLLPTETIAAGSSCVLPSSGVNVVCRAALANSGTVSLFRWGMWRFDGDAFSLILRDGSSTPGLPGYTMAGRYDFTGLNINAQGDLSIYARAENGSVGESLLLKGQLNSLTPAVRRGDTAPGLTGDEFIGGIGKSVIADSGEILFSALVASSSGPVSTDRRYGVWVLENDGTLSKVLRSGDDAPVLSGDEFVTYGYVFAPIEFLNSDGEVTVVLNDVTNSPTDPNRFGSRLNGSAINEFNNQAIWHGSPGSLDLVIRDGDPALDIPGKVYYIGNGMGTAVATNDAGQLAFVARTSDSGMNTNSSDPSALYIFDGGQLTNVLTTNQNITLVSGETVRLEGLSNLKSGNRTGAASAFNNAGLIAVGGRFRDPLDNQTVLWTIFLVGTSAGDPPVANAGADQSYRPVTTITLDGSGSFDDNTPSEDLGFAWSFQSWPGSVPPMLTGATTVAPTFVADLEGAYELSLVVTDSAGQTSQSDGVTISSDNLAPTADAGMNWVVLVGTNVLLDGGASSDPENDPLSFQWNLSAVPSGSNSFINNSNTQLADFVPDIAGDFDIELIVSDLIGPSLPATVVVTALDSNDWINYLISLTSGQIASLDPSQVVNSGLQNQLVNRMGNVADKYGNGQTADAISQLEKAIKRTDGCAVNGLPDGNGPERDYIVDCSAQSTIYNNMQMLLVALQNS